MIWLLAWRYLWVPALALLALGFWLLMLGRRRERARTHLRLTPRLALESLPYFALPWDGDGPAVGNGDPALTAPESPLPTRLAPSEGEPATTSPLAMVFNTLSSPGGCCAKQPMGAALRRQEPIIRAAVNSGEGHGASFKIAGVVEWPLWSRLPSRTGMRPATLMLVNESRIVAHRSEALTPVIVHERAVETLTAISPAELVDALEEYLGQHPAPQKTSREVGLSLLADAQKEPDETTRAGLLEGAIRILHKTVALDDEPDTTLAWGKACFARALIGPEVDEALLMDAEGAFRQVVRREGALSQQAVWLLQQTLQVMPGGWTREQRIERLDEAVTLLTAGVALTEATPEWRGALLRTSLHRIVVASQNGNERRLRLRELHAAWLPGMLEEMAADVLAAWVQLLCTMAAPLSGHAAQERYAEAQVALRRLHADAGESERYAQAFAEVALGRSRLLRDASRTAPLEEAGAILQPYVGSNNRLRLQACKVALAQAKASDAPEAQRLYSHAVALGRPLTAVPTFAIEALCCVLSALLMLGEEKERRVYARCLEVVTGPDDVEALLLLAECQLRAGDHRAGCLHAEMAWRGGATLSPSLLALWQAAYAVWSSQAESAVEISRNRNCLRMAASVQRERVAVAR